MPDTVTLPPGTVFGKFVPIAYYDKHMDCIRVLTHDRSITEHRLDGFLTPCECNHRSEFDPEYVGFVLKGVRHLFARVGLPLDGVYKLAEIIDRIIKHQPESAMARVLGLVYKDYQVAGDLEIDFQKAA